MFHHDFDALTDIIDRSRGFCNRTYFGQTLSVHEHEENPQLASQGLTQLRFFLHTIIEEL